MDSKEGIMREIGVMMRAEMKKSREEGRRTRSPRERASNRGPKEVFQTEGWRSEKEESRTEVIVCF